MLSQGEPPIPITDTFRQKTITEIDIKNLRTLRHTKNVSIVMEALVKDISKKELEKICNKEELKRVLEETSSHLNREFSFTEFHTKCKEDEIYRIMVSGRICICSSRQGGADESHILRVCNETTSKYGVVIHQLQNQELRPHKYSGKLITKDEYNRGKGEYKKSDCLKSFDAKITGKKEGYLFAKVCIGSGGHQDNVFHEAHSFGEWAMQYGEEDKLYIILIDTNLMNQLNELKSKYNTGSKVYVVDHKELQTLLIK